MIPESVQNEGGQAKGRPTILIITDSLAFPRTDPERVSYSQTYIALLRQNFPQYDIIHCGVGGATLPRLFNYSAYYHRTLTPDLCVIQSGIVDCAPRTLTEVEQQVVARLPIIGSLIGRLVVRYSRQLRSLRRIRYTTAGEFEEYVRRFEKIFERVCWIKIAPILESYEARVPGMTKSAKLFNDILDKSLCISLDDFEHDEMMSDFHHITAQGHEKILQRISDVIEDIRKEDVLPSVKQQHIHGPST